MLPGRALQKSLLTVLGIAVASLLVLSVPLLARPPAAEAAGTYVCPNGQVIPIGAMCVNSGYTTTTSSGTYVCPNGQVIPIGAMCINSGSTTTTSSGTYVCPNGQVIPIGAMCTNSGNQPSATTGTYVCPNGQVIPVGAMCINSSYQPAVSTTGTYVCPNGEVIPIGALCVNSGYSPTTSTGTYTCPNGQVIPIGALCTSSSYPTAGFTLSYPAGWNLVAGPSGTTLTSVNGPLYTWQAGDAAYETIPAGTPLVGGEGYWLYLPQVTTLSITVVAPASLSVPLPADHWVMIGNPGDTTATVSGADTVLTYNPAIANYVPATQLQPGQGAWALSQAGGQVTIADAAS